MPIDPTQNSNAEDFRALADGDDTEGHLGAAVDEQENAPEGFRAAFADKDDDDTEGHFRAL